MAQNPFPVENIPFGIISTAGNFKPRPATIIEDTVIDLQVFQATGAFEKVAEDHVLRPAFDSEYLNTFAELPQPTRSALRKRIQEIWRDDTVRAEFSAAYIDAAYVTSHLPMHTVNYTDYVSSRGHFENLNKMHGTSEARMCPFYHMPAGYYGNSRNVVVSGTDVTRFRGIIGNQFQKAVPAISGPSERFDFELELGVYLCKSGSNIPLEEVDGYVFGFVLLNDWSARDIQGAESGGPTGPFLAKSGCVTVSPWIVTLDALSVSRLPRQHQPVVPFVDYLTEAKPRSALNQSSEDRPCFDIRCSLLWSGAESNRDPFEACRAEYRETYWTYRQLLAHQTRNGSMVGSGDLLGTGTMSMFEGDDFGRCCAAERTYNGTKRLDIGGESRTWIEDGDEINLQGWVHDALTGRKLFGFGDCRGCLRA